MSANSASTQTQTTPVSPVSSVQPIDFNANDTKAKQINNLNAEVKALKFFIIEQLFVKKSIEDFKGQESIPNSSVLIQSLKEESNYLQNENLTTTSTIKFTDRKPLCSYQYYFSCISTKSASRKRTR